MRFLLPTLIVLLATTRVSMVNVASGLCAVSRDPTAADYTGREGTTLYVSKEGDNSDGSTWTKAYVQFKQPIPKGFERLGLWPTELFSQMAPPRNPTRPKIVSAEPR